MEGAAELRALARVERDPRQRVRSLAIAAVREGMPGGDAARATGMGRATPYRGLARERDPAARRRPGGAGRPPARGPAARARRRAAGRGQGVGAGRPG
jgi:hypothetical protein